MPLPKGIYSNPAVRQAWMAERQAKLTEFDRLTGKGIAPSKAARAVGMSRTGIASTRESLERLEAGQQTTGRAKGERIDLGLALLSLANPPGPGRVSMTVRDIAAWCDCTPAGVQSIERRALAKLQRRLEPFLRGRVVAGHFVDEQDLDLELEPVAAAA